MRYCFFQLSSPAVVLRRDAEGAIDELTADGWQSISTPAYSAEVAAATPQDAQRLMRRCRQRLNDTPLDAPARKPSGGTLSRRVGRWLSPPLDYGAPRHFGDELSRLTPNSRIPKNFPRL